MAMCGRFTYFFLWKQLHLLMDLVAWPGAELSPRYNVAPTQMAPIIRRRADGGREAAFARWGLVPAWADDPTIGTSLINARSETVASKPTFRTAFAQRRCLVPISGFYEWRARPWGKQPHLIRRVDQEPFALAGLWEVWKHQGESVESFTILTTTPNALMEPLHDRMPVILDAGGMSRWLDPKSAAPELIDLIRPCSVEGFEAFPVSRRVNGTRIDEPGLMVRCEENEPGLFG
jgi:putative SOS response-associated peptidase YedK